MKRPGLILIVVGLISATRQIPDALLGKPVAAALLPYNDPRTFFILHTAGNWLANRQPKVADRFYQVIIRRCPEHPRWPALDKRRWFLLEPVPNPIPGLLEELRFIRSDVALRHRASS